MSGEEILDTYSPEPARILELAGLPDRIDRSRESLKARQDYRTGPWSRHWRCLRAAV